MRTIIMLSIFIALAASAQESDPCFDLSESEADQCKERLTILDEERMEREMSEENYEDSKTKETNLNEEQFVFKGVGEKADEE